MSEMACFASSIELFFRASSSAHPLTHHHHHHHHHRLLPPLRHHQRLKSLQSPHLTSSNHHNKASLALASVNGRPSSLGRSNNRNNRSKSVAKKKEKDKVNPWNDDVDVVDQTHRSSALNKKPASNSASSSKKQRNQTGGSTVRRNVEEDSDPRKNLEKDSQILVSGSMPVETEQVLQTREPASTPSWHTFVSSLSGVWRGVGAAFSPMTAEMEAIALGDNEEMLYDSRIHSTVEQIQAKGSKDCIYRKTIWAVGNPLGEQNRGKSKMQEMMPQEDINEEYIDNQYDTESDLELSDDIIVEEVDTSFQLITDSHKGVMGDVTDWDNELYDDIILKEEPDADGKLLSDCEKGITTDLERKDLTYDMVMEEDVLELEPGLVLFEDGSYSRGPVELLTAESSAGEHTYKIEQCVVRGGHSRLRLVHTLAIEEEEETVQLLRVAVYEEEWMGPRNMKSISDSGGHHIKLFSQKPRLQQQDLVGTWKVFELSATPVFPDNQEESGSTDRPPFIYMTMETLKRRTLPEIPIHFVDEDILDMQDVTVMWLPGGINAYVEIKGDGIFTIGVGWYEDGVNLVMERDYTSDGKLSDVRSKTEIKGGWIGGRM